MSNTYYYSRLLLFVVFLLRVGGGDVLCSCVCAGSLRGVSYDAARKCVVLQKEEVGDLTVL